MKIICAAHGTGKTTLLKALKTIEPEYYTTDGYSRPVKKIKNLINLSDVNEQIVINELTIWAFDNYLTQKNVISGRSPIDAIVYSNLLFPEIDTTEMEQDFIAQLHLVEKIFYIPIEFDIEDDGMRFIDKQFQKDIDLAILAFYKKHNIQTIVLTGSVENRINEMVKYL